MQSTWSLREPLIPYEPEPNNNLRKIENQGVPVNPKRVNQSYGAGEQPPYQLRHTTRHSVRIILVISWGRNLLQPNDFKITIGALEYWRFWWNSCPNPFETWAHIILKSILTQMLTTRGLFWRLQSEDQHGHMKKPRSVCKICVGKQNIDMNGIGLRVYRYN